MQFNTTLPLDASLLKPEDIDRFDAIKKLHLTRATALEHIRKVQDRMKTRYDAFHDSTEFQPGDIVRVFAPKREKGLDEKLLSHYYEPY